MDNFTTLALCFVPTGNKTNFELATALINVSTSCFSFIATPTKACGKAVHQAKMMDKIWHLKNEAKINKGGISNTIVSVL